MTNSETANDLRLHIHGDNVVECERALGLILESFGVDQANVEGPFGTSTAPCFRFNLDSVRIKCQATFFPGFGRWNQDIRDVIQTVPNALREAADVIISVVENGNEVPKLAIEFCGALPAGNQAWQRSGRAYSCGVAGLPYLYVAELGGYELTNERKRKAPRVPNPVVPFSYLTYSRQKATAIMPVFVSSLGADQNSRQQFDAIFGEGEMKAIVASSILGVSTQSAVDALSEKTVQLLQVLSTGKSTGATLSPEQWSDCWKSVKTGESVTDYIVDHAWTKWSKRTSITSITATAKAVMTKTAAIATGFASNSLPLCIVPAGKRHEFRDLLLATYGALEPAIEAWLKRQRNLTICWVLGFKPRGDDARPDRGLPPLAKMLCDQDDDILSFVYGPAPQRTWSMLRSDPVALAKQNGLWEAIITVSDAIIIDSSTNSTRGEAFIIPQDLGRRKNKIVIPAIKPIPNQFGENDVDTALHLMLKYQSGNVFEGMCNPPGGDWSGISVLSANKVTEFRWLSLPRVSGKHAKRPDHVFQIFGRTRQPIIWSVESKETATSVEKSIGPRLNAYLQDLFSHNACVSRTNCSESFHHASKQLDYSKFTFASGAAFILNEPSDMIAVGKKAKVDLVLGFQFDTTDGSCEVYLKHCSTIGKKIAQTICGSDCSEIALQIQHFKN